MIKSRLGRVLDALPAQVYIAPPPGTAPAPAPAALPGAAPSGAPSMAGAPMAPRAPGAGMANPNLPLVDHLVGPPLVAPGGNGVIAAAGRRLLDSWEEWSEQF